LRGVTSHLADVLIDSDLAYADAKIDSVRFFAVVSRKLFGDKISVQKFLTFVAREVEVGGSGSRVV
jgi:hypothetical protein